ncbi:glycosyltransferase family 4 protein [Candidatus Sulfurimonas marisnigri]|uniref:Glycosyltransferase family 4 protein n=1 Tax=Candidatus Sulfurimonas marisnigri TaxID=2740405 RepID=A0A7S7RPY7_9BACT|nr:glycosyltransferase family 4 protein [Candidatus Sulfurimonas marisnigri]QOY54059.1 glycosyltransferase family 4 protein [Candidatus Sulfurimonas marisnigri]
MKKRILIVTEYFYPEEFKINEIAIAWKEKGYDVDVLTQNPTYPFGEIYKEYENKWYAKDTYNGINIFRVKAVTGYKSSLYKKLLKYFTFMILGSIVSLKIGKKYDYVFGFDIAALTCMVPAVILKKTYKKNVTLWVQDVWPDSVYAYGFKKTKLLEFMLNGFVKFVYRNSSNFAISAKGFENKIKLYLDDSKEIRYLPNWADEFNEELEPFVFSDEKKVHFTFAGNVGKVQNLDNILLAYGNLADDLIDKSQINIIGDGSHLESLKKLVKDNSLKNILFWGRKPREEMYKYFKASDFLIVSLIDKPIFSLTVPAKTQTYIAANKPLFGVIKGEASDIIKDNNLGFCTEPDNIEDIKNVFEKAIYANPKEIEEFTRNGRKLTNTVFNKEKIISSLLDLLIGKEK